MPQTGKPTIQIGDDEIEIDMGIHGVPGVWRSPLKPVYQVIDRLLEHLNTDRPFVSGDKVSILVNSPGATPIMELCLVFRRAKAGLADMGGEVVLPMVGNSSTSMEMAGASITLMKLDDEV